MLYNLKLFRLGRKHGFVDYCTYVRCKMLCFSCCHTCCYCLSCTKKELDRMIFQLFFCLWCLFWHQRCQLHSPISLHGKKKRVSLRHIVGRLTIGGNKSGRAWRHSLGGQRVFLTSVVVGMLLPACCVVLLRVCDQYVRVVPYGPVMLSPLRSSSVAFFLQVYPRRGSSTYE